MGWGVGVAEAKGLLLLRAPKAEKEWLSRPALCKRYITLCHFSIAPD
jgi:hypothetical protein